MPKALQIDVPSDIANAAPYQVPEDATVATIEATIAKIQADAERLLDGDRQVAGKTTAERMAEATWLMDSVDALNGRKTEIVQAQQAEQAAMDELRQRLNANGGDDAEGEGDDENDDDEDGEGEQAQGGEGAPDGAAAPPAPPAAPAPQAEPVLVASAGVAARRSAIADAASKRTGQPQPVAPGTPRAAYLVAAADTGFAGGQKIDWAEAGRAAEARFASLPSPDDAPSPAVKLRFADVRIPSDTALVASGKVNGQYGKEWDLDAAIAWALSPERLERETGMRELLAAGGWCAPSETLYDLVDITTADGMIDVAGITVARGGVRYSLGPDFSAVYSAGANFTKTEAQAIAGSAKPVVNIPCPSFTDNRMSVDGLYLTGDILSARGYPEAYSDFTQKALKAFAHYVNKSTIADMVTLATAVDLQQGGSPPPFENVSVTTELLGAVELQVTDMRYRNRMSLTQMVEVVLPYWAKGTIRSDMAKRANVGDPAGVTDANIESWFALRGARVQWVYDWQDFFATGSGLGAATAALAWPTTVKFLIYPQGGFVRALSDVIELNAIYDSTLLTTNQYVALFMEQARLVLKRVPDVRVCTTKVLITGATGAAKDYTALQPTV